MPGAFSWRRSQVAHLDRTGITSTKALHRLHRIDCTAATAPPRPQRCGTTGAQPSRAQDSVSLPTSNGVHSMFHFAKMSEDCFRPSFS